MSRDHLFVKIHQKGDTQLNSHLNICVRQIQWGVKRGWIFVLYSLWVHGEFCPAGGSILDKMNGALEIREALLFHLLFLEYFLFQSHILRVVKTNLSEDIRNKASPLRQPGDENNLSELASRQELCWLKQT